VSQPMEKMSVKALGPLKAGVASAKVPSHKSVSGGRSVMRDTGNRVSPMTQADIDGTAAPRDHGLRAREFGRRAIVSRRAKFRRWLFSWFVNPSKSDFEETLADHNARQSHLY